MPRLVKSLSVVALVIAFGATFAGGASAEAMSKNALAVELTPVSLKTAKVSTKAPSGRALTQPSRSADVAGADIGGPYALERAATGN